jgi:hypothetical protein
VAFKLGVAIKPNMLSVINLNVTASFTNKQASLLQPVANVIKLFIAVSYDFSQ